VTITRTSRDFVGSSSWPATPQASARAYTARGAGLVMEMAQVLLDGRRCASVPS